MIWTREPVWVAWTIGLELKNDSTYMISALEFSLHITPERSDFLLCTISPLMLVWEGRCHAGTTGVLSKWNKSTSIKPCSGNLRFPNPQSNSIKVYKLLAILQIRKQTQRG